MATSRKLPYSSMMPQTAAIYIIAALLIFAVLVFVFRDIRWIRATHLAKKYFPYQQLPGWLQLTLVDIAMLKSSPVKTPTDLDAKRIIESAIQKFGGLNSYCGFSYHEMLGDNRPQISWRFDVCRPDLWHVMQYCPDGDQLDEWVTTDKSSFTNSGLWTENPERRDMYIELQQKIGIDNFYGVLRACKYAECKFIFHKYGLKPPTSVGKDFNRAPQALKNTEPFDFSRRRFSSLRDETFAKLRYRRPYANGILDSFPAKIFENSENVDELEIFVNRRMAMIEKVVRNINISPKDLPSDESEVPQDLPERCAFKTASSFSAFNDNINVSAPDWVNAEVQEDGKLIVTDINICNMPFHK